MPGRFTLALTGVLAWALAAAGTASAAETNTRIAGVSAGRGCDEVAVAVLRLELRYPLLGGLSGWSRGVPTIQRNTAELYLYRPSSGALKRVASVDAPRRWRASSRYTMLPRHLPDGSLVVMLRGCPKDQENCDESRVYRLADERKLVDLPAWPDASAEESAQLRQCTAKVGFEDGRSHVAIGPTGGPWRPVLELTGHRLVPWQTRP